MTSGVTGGQIRPRRPWTVALGTALLLGCGNVTEHTLSPVNPPLVRSDVQVRSTLVATEHRLTATDASAHDLFGLAVAIDSNLGLVGAFRDDDNGTDSGSAYVFDGSSGWSQVAKLTASDGAAGDFFGVRIGMVNSQVLIGAWGDDDNGTSSGAAYVMELAQALIVQIDILPDSDENCFNNDGNGVIPVAILGSADLDATEVDPSTVRLEGMEVQAAGKAGNLQAQIEDVNSDGFDDLVVHIEDVDGTFTSGSGTAQLSGELLDGTPIRGTDEICVVP